MPSALGHVIERDGVVVGVVAVAGDAWDDFSFVDANVVGGRSYAYRARTIGPDGTLGPLSAPALVNVRGAAELGQGRVYEVDAFSGSDIERAEAAVRAAQTAGGGVVRFGARTYRFSRPLVLRKTRDIVLRGAGTGSTFIQPDRSGPTGDACVVTPTELIVVEGDRLSLPTRATAPIEVGDRAVTVSSVTGLREGQVVLLDESPSGSSPKGYEAAGILQDPGTGRDRRVPWDANRIKSISGTKVTFQYPWAQSFSANVTWQTMAGSTGNAVESLTLQGPSATDRGMYRLLRADHTVAFTVADVRARWANRNFLELKGYDVRLVGFRGTDGGAASYDETSCKYKVTAFRISNLLVVDSVFGEPDHDRNQSFLTFQKAQRVVVRGSVFHGSRTYGVNEHGSGGRFHVVENNFFSVGPNAKFGAILLGNSSWGFAGPVVIRNNLFVGNSRELAMQENSYEIRFVDNVSRGSRVAVVDGYGWAGPDTERSRWGSLRMTIARNVVEDGRGDGIVLGRRAGNYPYLGVTDVAVVRNRFDVAGAAFAFSGSGTRLRVYRNTGSNRYTVPPLDAASDWYGNPDGRDQRGSVEYAKWSDRYFSWQAFDGFRPNG